MVERRLKWLAWIIVSWGVVIFCKLFTLQIIRHDEYVRMARRGRKRPSRFPRLGARSSIGAARRWR